MTVGLLLLALVAGDGAATTPEPAQRWYGGPGLAIDAGAAAAVVGGAALGGNLGLGLGAAGVLGALTISPLHHDWGGQPRRTDTSLALRVGGFAVGVGGFLLVALSTTCTRESPDPACPDLKTAAFLAPLVVAMVIDDLFLSYGPVAPPPRKPPGVSLRPIIAPRFASTGAVAGLAAAF